MDSLKSIHKLYRCAVVVVSSTLFDFSCGFFSLGFLIAHVTLDPSGMQANYIHVFEVNLCQHVEVRKY